MKNKESNSNAVTVKNPNNTKKPRGDWRISKKRLIKSINENKFLKNVQLTEEAERLMIVWQKLSPGGIM